MRAQYFRGNLFVANLPPDFSDDQLAEAFDPFGMVLSAFVARDPATGKRLRYGFVDIATERAARRAVDAMNGTAISGHNINVRISERPAARSKNGPSRPQSATRHAPPRPAARDRASDPGLAGDVAPAPAPRSRPSFQVEHRSLPRRFETRFRSD
ncbi:MAG: RNA recognition motif domain-containing protein [Stellaceae bacterium]